MAPSRTGAAPGRMKSPFGLRSLAARPTFGEAFPVRHGADGMTGTLQNMESDMLTMCGDAG